MANLIILENKVERKIPAVHGEEITIKAPCNCSDVTGVQIAGVVYPFYTAAGKPMAMGTGLFATDNLIRVLIDTENTRATIINHASTPDTINAMHRKISVVPVDTSTVLMLSHAEKTVLVNSDSNVTITIPTNETVAFPIGTTINVCGIGTGVVSFVAESGATLNIRNNESIIDGQYAAVALYKSDANTWYAWGATA